MALLVNFIEFSGFHFVFVFLNILRFREKLTSQIFLVYCKDVRWPSRWTKVPIDSNVKILDRPMRTVLLKSRTILRSSEHFLFLIISPIFCLVHDVEKYSPQKSRRQHTLAGLGLGDISCNKIVAVHLIAGLKFAWLSRTHCLLEFALFVSPAFAWTAPLRTLTKRFDRNCQKQHKTISFSQVFRNLPILRRLLLNLSTKGWTPGFSAFQTRSWEKMPPPYSHPGLLNFSELAETRIRQIIHISVLGWSHCPSP